MIRPGQLSGEFKQAIDGKKRFVAVRVAADIAKDLDQHRVEYRGQFESTLVSMLLSWVVPILIFGGIWMFLGRRMAKQFGGPGGGLMAIGKSKAKVYVETDTKVTFADVAGVDEAKAELQEVVAFLKDPKQHGRLGARMPKGALWSALQAPARRCWPRRWRAKLPCRSSPSPARSSWRCSSAWAPPA